MKTLQGHSVRGPSVLNPLFFRNFAHGLPRGRQAQRRGHRPGSPAASLSEWVTGKEEEGRGGGGGDARQGQKSAETLHAGSDSLHLVQEAVELRQS